MLAKLTRMVYNGKHCLYCVFKKCLSKPEKKIMGLSEIEFTPDEMKEMETAAAESFRSRPLEKTLRLPKGAQLEALKQMMENGKPEAVAAIAGISLEQLQSITE
jgi:hypothetical protein